MSIPTCDPFKVRCIHGNRDQLNVGDEYTVIETFDAQGRLLYGFDKHWPGHLFGAWRFERIEETAA